MKNFPFVYNLAAIVNEMKVYAAFFDENTNVDYSTDEIINRVWSYKWSEDSFLANKIILIYNKYEATLYDFSALLTEEVTIENCKNFENSYCLKVYDLTKERLNISQIKEILANNAKAAIRAEYLTKQVKKFKSMSEDF